MSVAARNSDHSLELASQSRRRPLADLRVKRAAREKERRVLMVNLAGHHHQEVVERPLLAAQPEVDHPRREPSVAKSSHNTERDNQRKERRGQDHNSSGVIWESGSGNRNSGATFLQRHGNVMFIVGRLCQTLGRSPRRASYNNSAICTAFRAAPLSN